jgi:alkylation response protein AidB-like acyl-CoA dehydrogenase
MRDVLDGVVTNAQRTPDEVADAYGIGADGLSAPGILADLYAHARSLRISDGPDEVHRRVVGRHELSPRATVV